MESLQCLAFLCLLVLVKTMINDLHYVWSNMVQRFRGNSIEIQTSFDSKRLLELSWGKQKFPILLTYRIVDNETTVNYVSKEYNTLHMSLLPFSLLCYSREAMVTILIYSIVSGKSKNTYHFLSESLWHQLCIWRYK